MEQYKIPHYLDEPFRLILWTVDEVCLFSLPFLLLGFYFDAIFSGLALGLGLCFLLRRLKGDQGHYFIYNVMYWYLPNIIKQRATPPSYLREFVG